MINIPQNTQLSNKFIDLILNYKDIFHKYVDTAKQIKMEASIVGNPEENVITPKPKPKNHF